jgi:predicted dehydrogenase
MQRDDSITKQGMRAKMDQRDSGEIRLTRRKFIRAAGVCVAGIAVARSPVYSLASSSVMGANDRIRVGFIGCGEIGQIHIGILKGLQSQANVFPAAVCDVWEKRRLQAKKAAGVPDSKVYSDYRKLLDDRDIDAVVISTPEHWHAAMATDAIQKGTHCFLEKPFARHLDEALKLYDVARNAKKVVVQVGVQGCSDAKWAKANELIRAGRLGKLVWSQGSFCLNSKDGEWNNPIDPDANESNLDWKSWLGPCPSRPFDPKRYFRWRKYWDYCGGIISDHFPHILFPLMLALGPEFPSRVTCIGTRAIDTDQEVPDTNHAIVEFSSGHSLTISGSNATEQGLRDTVRGHEATMYLSSGRIEIIPEKPFADELDIAEVSVPGTKGSHDEHLKNFLDCIRDGKSPNCPIDLAVRAQVVVSLAEMSYRTHKMVGFDPKGLKVIP